MFNCIGIGTLYMNVPIQFELSNYCLSQCVSTNSRITTYRDVLYGNKINFTPQKIIISHSVQVTFCFY